MFSDELHFLLYEADERVHVLQELGHILSEDISKQCIPIMVNHFMFGVPSTMGAKLGLVVLTRNDELASYQLQLEEEMV